MLTRRNCLKLTAAQLLAAGFLRAEDRSRIAYPYEKTRFLVFADLHHGAFTPDSVTRLQSILARAEEEKVDFIIQLGDFAAPSSGSNAFREIWNACPIPRYGVLGNHDVDSSTKAVYNAYWGIPDSRYVFQRGVFRFVALDSNFFRDASGNVQTYSTGNYYGKPELDVFAPEQINWVERLLNDKSPFIYFFFSHAPINNTISGVGKNQAFHDVLTAAQARGVRIAGAFSGHNHSDSYHRIGTMNYFQVNSSSYLWDNGVVTYANALSAIVEVSESGEGKIMGMDGAWLPPAPTPERFANKPYPCTPMIANRDFSFRT